MAYGFDDLLDQNKAIIEAYNRKRCGVEEVCHMPSDIPHKVYDDADVKTYSFDPEHVDSVHAHLISTGFKQEGPTHKYSTVIDSRMVKQDGKDKTVAYIGRNKNSGWLDIHKND